MSGHHLAIAGALAHVLGAAACGPTADADPEVDGASAAAADAAGDAPLSDSPDAEPEVDGGTRACSALPVTVRDFRISHPDFEHFTSDAVTPGLVEPTLGPDGTPTYAPDGPTICTTGAAEFAQWYHDVDGVNQAIPITLELAETTPGVYVFDSAEFFPIDDQGFGNEGQAHNFAFTTEVHTTFEYEGGETFTFRGDDDLWLFINDTLAIDLGGLHQPAQATLSLDAEAANLGITPGETYAMDIFQAERHTTASNFRVETTIDCFIVE